MRKKPIRSSNVQSLEFARKLQLAGVWPPYIPWEKFRYPEHEPVTPYLLCPVTSVRLKVE
jgi:hypothetical protein